MTRRHFIGQTDASKLEIGQTDASKLERLNTPTIEDAARAGFVDPTCETCDDYAERRFRFDPINWWEIAFAAFVGAIVGGMAAAGVVLIFS